MKELIEEGLVVLKSIDAELKKINNRVESAPKQTITCPADLVDQMNLPEAMKKQVKSMLGGLTDGQ